MKNILFLVLLQSIAFVSLAQKALIKASVPIIEEGKKLYTSEKTSWQGTSLFLNAYLNRGNIGGSFSYLEGNGSTCIFFNKAEKPKVIGTIRFDETLADSNAIVNIDERDFTPTEQLYLSLRNKAIQVAAKDSFFKRYKSTDMIIIPLLSKTEMKVYLITETSEEGQVILGNDYLLKFDANYELISKVKIHKGIQLIYPSQSKDANHISADSSFHIHTPDMNDLPTATDICILMLYGETVGWKKHYTIGQKYCAVWDCKNNSLSFITRAAYDKLYNLPTQKRK